MDLLRAHIRSNFIGIVSELCQLYWDVSGGLSEQVSEDDWDWFHRDLARGLVRQFYRVNRPKEFSHEAQKILGRLQSSLKLTKHLRRVVPSAIFEVLEALHRFLCAVEQNPRATDPLCCTRRTNFPSTTAVKKFHDDTVGAMIRHGFKNLIPPVRAYPAHTLESDLVDSDEDASEKCLRSSIDEAWTLLRASTSQDISADQDSLDGTYLEDCSPL